MQCTMHTITMNEFHQPFLLECDSSQTAVLCVHGILGSPGEFREIAQALHQQGLTVQAVCLPGHGGESRPFINNSISAWQTHVDMAATELLKKYQRVFLIGHSMGGLLGLRTAVHMPLTGVITLNTPLRTRITFGQLRLGLRILLTSAEHDDAMLRAYRDSFSTSPQPLWEVPLWLPRMMDVIRLGKMTEVILGQVTAPVLIIQSKRDETVNPISARMLVKGLINADTRMIYLEKSVHAWFDAEEFAEILKQIFLAIKPI